MNFVSTPGTSISRRYAAVPTLSRSHRAVAVTSRQRAACASARRGCSATHEAIAGSAPATRHTPSRRWRPRRHAEQSPRLVGLVEPDGGRDRVGADEASADGPTLDAEGRRRPAPASRWSWAAQSCTGPKSEAISRDVGALSGTRIGTHASPLGERLEQVAAVPPSAQGRTDVVRRRPGGRVA